MGNFCILIMFPKLLSTKKKNLPFIFKKIIYFLYNFTIPNIILFTRNIK